MIVEFKFAVATDLPKIVETYNSTIPSRLVTADLEPISVESKQAWFNAHDSNHRPLWIVLIDSDYAGWMSFNSFYGRPAYDGAIEVSIYIEEKHRGKKLGKACLQKAIEVAPSLNITHLLGFIFGHNTPSLNLFYQFDFKNWGHLPEIANMDGVYRDLIILGRRIV
jgi:L-amino acid N-acyltransferase YncA